MPEHEWRKSNSKPKPVWLRRVFNCGCLSRFGAKVAEILRNFLRRESDQSIAVIERVHIAQSGDEGIIKRTRYDASELSVLFADRGGVGAASKQRLLERKNSKCLRTATRTNHSRESRGFWGNCAARARRQLDAHAGAADNSDGQRRLQVRALLEVFTGEQPANDD